MRQRRLVQWCLRALGLGLAIAASGAFAAVGVNKTFNPTNVSAGQTSTLTVILLNNNAFPATGVGFTDNLPGTVVVATPPNTTTTCGAAVTATPGVGNFSVAGGTIPAAAAGVAGQCTVTVDVMSPAAGVFINNIPAGAVSSSQGTNPQNANATLTVAALQPVTGAKVFAPANLHGGGTASTVTLTLTNPNGVALTNAALADTLPAGLAIAAPPNASTTCGAGTVATGVNSATLSNGTIPANGNCTIKFDVVASAPNVFVDGNVTNTIPASALGTAQGVTNAAAFAANVRLQTGGRVEKVFAPTPITTGGTSTLTVTVRNFNATPLAGIAFTDTFPGTMRVATPVVTGTTCTGLAFTPVPLAGDAFFTVSGGSLPAAPAGVANANCTVTINVTATNAGLNPVTLTNTIPVGNFGGVAFSSAGGNLVVNAVTSVGGSKAFVPATILQGGVSTLTITLTNSAAVAATITAFTDALTTLGASPQFTVAAAPAATTTCGGVLNAAPGANTITLGAGNSIPPLGGCTITVPVQASAVASTGARTNTIAQGAMVTSQGRTQSAITGVLTVTPVLSVAKAFAPLTVAAGTDTRMTITVTRAAGAVALTGLAFTDTLPAGHLVSAAPNLVNNCGGGVTATSGTNIVSLAGGGLLGGAAATSCTILVNITTPAGAGSGTNTIAAGAVTSAQGFINPAAASATVTRVVTSVTINKSFTPATVLVGGTSQLTINIINTNANAIALTAGALTDTFPLGMAVAAAPGATNNCGGTFTPLAGATSVSLSNASIAANASCRIQVNVVANSAGNLINPLAAGAFASAQGVTNPLPASATLAATGVANLGITKTDGVATVVPGTSTTYTIVASNGGPNAVSGANVVDTPPAGVSFTSWTCVASAGSSCGNANGSGPINELVSLLNAGTATYTVIAAIAPGATGTIANTATITVPATVVDPTPGNNTATDTDTLTPVAALAVSKTDGSLTYTPGGTAIYTVVVTNSGPSTAASVTVSDPLPAGVTLNASVTCVATGTANCGAVTGTAGQTSFGTSGATVGPGVGNSLTFTVPVSFASGLVTNPLVNTVTATGPTSPLATASDSDVRAAVAALAVSKTDGSATYTPGGSATYTVVVTNAGPSSASSVSVSDPLPAGVTLSANATCVATGAAACGAVTGTTGQTSFGTTGAAVAAGAGNLLTFTVPVSFAPGMVTNPLVNTVTATDPSSPVATGSDSDARSALAALAVTKTDGSATYTPGGSATYTVTVTNAGPSNANSITVSDPLPAGVTLSANAACVASGTANCGTVTGTTGQSSFGATGATIAAGAANKLVFTVPVAFAAGMNTNPLINTATATDPASVPATGSDSDALAAVAALAVSKTDGSATYTPGGTATYTVVVTNAGPSSASNVTVSDPLPAGVTLSANATCVATGSASCGTVTGSTGQSSFGTTNATVGAGAGNTLTFTVPVAFAAGMVTNPLINTATATDPSSAPATGSDSDARSAVAALAVTKTDGSATYTPGGAATYTVVVTNAGPSNATSVTVSDPLPAGVTLSASATCVATGAASCGAVTGTTGQTSFGSTGATVGAGAGNSLTFTVPVSFAAGMVTNPLVNTVTVTDPSSAPATGSDSDARAAVAALAVSKSDGSATYTPGGTATYTVVVTNAGPSSAASVTLSDPFPAGVTLSANATCAASGTATCGAVTGTSGQTSFGTTGATVAAGAGNSLTFTVPVSFAAGMVTNPLVNTATATDPASPPATGSDSDARASVASLAVSKTDGSATYTPGGTATYTVVVTNAGPSNASIVTVSDPLPAGVTLSANATCLASGASTCGTVTGTTGQTSFGTTGATIGAGAGNSLTFTVPVAFAAGMVTNPLVNTATATDPASPPASGSDSDARSAVAALAVSKTDGSATYTPGGAATYTVGVTNAGPSNAINVTVSDPLPAGLTLSANATCVAIGSSNCGTVTGTTGQTSFGTTGATVGVGAGNSLTFTVPVAFASGMITDPLVNTAAATDPASPPATGSDSDTRAAVAALAVTKTDGSATYTPGGTATYTVTVTNAGPSNANNITVSDPLPAGVTLSANATCVASGTANCGAVTGTTGQTSFATTGATIAAGAANKLVFTVPVAFAPSLATNPLVNTATATDPASPPATGSDSDARSAVAALAVTKTDGSATYTPGGAATYTVTVTNAGPSNANSATVSDPLPAGVTLSANATCVASGASNCGTVTGTTGQTSFGTTGATVVSGAGNQLTFTVPVAFAPGMTTNPLVNTATATDPASPPATGSDSDTLAAQVALNVVKTDGSATYTPGGTATYTITVTNAGPSSASNVTITDALPAGVTLSANATCAATGTASCGAVTGTTGQTSFGSTGASVGAGAANKLVFTVPVAFAASMVADPIINSATATDLASSGPGSTATGTDTDSRSATVALVVVKTDGSPTYTPGGNAIYTVTVTNGGPSVATNMTVTDALPAGVTLNANATCVASGTASCGTVTGTPGQSAFGTTGATLGAAAANKLVFTVPVDFASSMTTDPLVNTATATDLGASGPGSSATGSDSDTRSAAVALLVTKTDGASTYTPGGTATYTITVLNTGTTDALDVAVTDALPPGVTLGANALCVANGTSSCGTVTGTAGQTSFGTTAAIVVPGGANTIVFTIPVTFAAGMSTNPLVNTATATDVPTGSTANGSDSDTLSSNVTLALVKTDGSATYTPGGTATYTVTVANTGLSDALNVNVTDALPAGVTLNANAVCVANGSSSCGTVTGTTGQPSFGATAARIDAGGANTLVFTVPVAFAAGMTTNPLVNTATAADVASGNSANGSDSDTLSAAVTLGVAKTDGSATYTPGGTATYTVTVTNTGLSDALNVTVTDPLPAGVTLNANAVCAANGTSSCGTVTGTTGQASFGATTARVDAGAGNAIVFTVPVAFAAAMTTTPLINTATATDIPTGITANGSDSDVLAANVTLAVTKTDGSATYTPGGTAIYTVTVANTGVSDALNVNVTDALPAGVTLNANAVCVANGSSSCGAVSGTLGQTAFGATAARIGAGGANTLVFTASVAFAAGLSANPLVNTASATDVPSGATASGSDSDALASSVTLAVTKTDGSATYTPGGTATYIVTVANTGVSDALDVTVTDPLPAGVTLNANATCVANGLSSCGTVTGAGGQTSFGATAAHVSAGAGNTLVFTVPVGFAPGMSTNPLVNTATATDLVSGASAGGSDSDTLVAAVGLLVSKTDGSATYTPGGVATYTIVVTNGGPSNAGSLTVTDNLPAGVTLSANATCAASGAATCGTVTGATGAASFGVTGATLAAGAGNQLTFSVPVSFAAGLATNPLVNTVTVSDPSAPAPVSASDSDTRAAVADVGIVKTGPASLIAGGPITYTLTLTNSGPSVADGATFNDNVPGVISGVAASCGAAAGGAACGVVSVVGNTVSGTVPLLPVGGSVVITISGSVSGAATGSFTNIGTIAPPVGTSDPTPGNASSSVTTTVGATTATQVPVNASWALALLLAAMGLLGARAAAARRPKRR